MDDSESSQRAQQEEAMRRLAEQERQEKSHAPAAAVFGVITGTVGGAVIGASLGYARQECGFFGTRQSDPWCAYVTAPGFSPAGTAFFIGIILAAIGYGAVYAFYYLTSSKGN
ncbi:hypothetical protein [Arthrobacter sp. HLT1-20]